MDTTNPTVSKTLTQIISKLRETKEFSMLLKKISNKLGVKITPTILDVFSRIAGVNGGMILTPNLPSNAPTLILTISFKTADDAKKIEAMLKEKIKNELADSISLKSTTIGGNKFMVIDRVKNPRMKEAKKMFKGLTFDYTLVGNTIAVYVVPKTDNLKDVDKIREAILANIGRSVKCIDGGNTIAKNKQYINFLKRTNGSYATLFIPSSLIDIVNSQSKDKIPQVIDYVGTSVVPTENFETTKSTILVVLKNIYKDKLLKSHFPLLKTTLKSGNSGMDALPADSIMAIGISLNITDALKEISPIKKAIEDTKRKGLDLNELFFNWFGGELAIGISKYDMPSDEQLKKQIFTAPDIYIAIKTKNGKATLASIDKLLKMSPIPLVPIDNKVEGIAIKNLPMPMTPPNIKGLSFAYGIIGDYFVLTSTKSGMKKAIYAYKNEKNLLSSSYYRTCGESGFISFFMNTEEITKMAKFIKKLDPNSKIEDIPNFQRAFAMTLSLTSDSFKLVVGTKADIKTAVDGIIAKLKEKFKIKK
jgi:hypothetical protein